MQKGENQATGKDGAKLSTITGCVAQSGALYRLNQAIIGTDPDVDTQARPSPEGTPKMLSYALIGADLKAHLGHKVEVTGTLTSDPDIERYHRNERNSGNETSRDSDCEVREDGRTDLPVKTCR